ncbi:hypothetical protein AOLI_G00251280 [Acnodon oligacanthus]
MANRQNSSGLTIPLSKASRQFYNGVQFEVSELFPGKDADKPDALMFVQGHRLVCPESSKLATFFYGLILTTCTCTLIRGCQKDFRKDVKKGENVPCWFIHNNGTGLIDGDLTDYIVSRLFRTN